MTDFEKQLFQALGCVGNLKRFQFIVWNEEQADIVKTYDPDADVAIMPERFREYNPDMQDKIYIFPKDDGLKPLKFVSDESTNIEFEFPKEFGSWDFVK